MSSVNSQRLDSLKLLYRDGLLHDTLPFWIDHCVDREHGGFMTSLDRDGTVIDTDKGIWVQGRFSWLLGKLYNNVEQHEPWLQLCKHGLGFLDAHCYDPSDGRMWFQVTRDGKPLRKRRYALGESFAAIAYGEYAKASGQSGYADKAERTFKRFVDHSLNPQGVQPKYTDVRPTRGIGFPMITINTAQELRGSIGLKEADGWIDRSIEAIQQYHMKPDLRCVMETVGPEGEIYDHFDGRTLNPGHAIEGAWFILREAAHRGNDPALIKIGCDMLDWMWERGWDKEHGGIFYFRDLNHLPVQEYWQDMKFWWPQNEAIIATLYAYVMTGDEKYARWHGTIHDWAYEHFPDTEHGEWFGYLHRDGSLANSLKGGLWKGPFHMPRMQLICWQLIEQYQSCGGTKA